MVDLNITLVYSRRSMMGDYEKIAEKIHLLSDRIFVHIAPDAVLNNQLMSRLRQWPSISFSPSLLLYFAPPRGPLYSGKVIAKSDQMKLLATAGIRTPKWTFLTPDKTFHEADWGKAVIIKPNAFGYATAGSGIELVRTNAVRYIPSQAYAPDHPGRHGLMLVQQFIDSGDHSEDYRVVTMFGHPLYALKRQSLIRMANIFEGDINRTRAGVVSNAGAREAREVHLCYEKPILDFASRIYLAIPQVPFQAVDIRRDANTGHLYCLEINPGGFTWNFSSKRARQNPTIDGIRREDQFGAWEIAAKALVSMVRSQAC